MFSSVFSATVSGVDGFRVTVETDVSGGLPGLEVVGMPATSVKSLSTGCGRLSGTPVLKSHPVELP